MEAERKKRANILDSEGDRESAINRAEGLRQSTILASEAVRIEQINKAKGQQPGHFHSFITFSFLSFLQEKQLLFWHEPMPERNHFKSWGRLLVPRLYLRAWLRGGARTNFVVVGVFCFVCVLVITIIDTCFVLL